MIDDLQSTEQWQKAVMDILSSMVSLDSFDFFKKKSLIKIVSRYSK